MLAGLAGLDVGHVARIFFLELNIHDLFSELVPARPFDTVQVAWCFAENFLTRLPLQVLIHSADMKSP
jgi:hypothetical protein